MSPGGHDEVAGNRYADIVPGKPRRLRCHLGLHSYRSHTEMLKSASERGYKKFERRLCPYCGKEPRWRRL